MLDEGLIGSNQSSKPETSKMAKGAVRWFYGLIILFALSIVVGWFDNTTELIPSHDNVLQVCFVMAGLGSLISACVAILGTKRMTFGQRGGYTVCLTLFGLLSVFLMSYHMADIVEGWVDFPPSKTKTYPTLLSIWRAYQTHGKGRSWDIQTTPVWSDMNITQDDYEFMLAHRRPGDNSRNADEISSHGYFCAQVTMQQSGKAFRVMHAGNDKLPQGTVIICPPNGSTPPR